LNTAKQVNIMIGLMFVGLFGTFLYFIFDNGFNAFGVEFEGREDAAAVRQEKTNVERGAVLYSLNCRACHGLTGEGALERAGLPGAPLNLDDNRPPELTEAQVIAKADRFNGTITCGRVGTLMPPWSRDENGPLNDFQIEQLVMLITSEFSEEGWEHVVEDGNHSDQFDPHKRLTAAIGASDTTIELNDASDLLVMATLRIGGDTIDEAYEVLIIVSIDEDTGSVEVERGALGSVALSHEAEAEVYNGPLPPPEGPILGLPGTVPPCGQKNVVPEAATGPSAVVSISGDVEFKMSDNFFGLDEAVNPTLEVVAGDTVAFTVPNLGTAIHNLRLAGPDGEYFTDDDFVSDPEQISGGDEGTLEVTFGEAATYPYQCDFHPTEMLGEVAITG
jgi:plastocyanin/mono/diheme cytochrome c family protein